MKEKVHRRPGKMNYCDDCFSTIIDYMHLAQLQSPFEILFPFKQ